MPTIGEQTNDSRIHYYWIYAANNCQFWNVHFVIYIFVLDIYCQLFGRYMSVGCIYWYQIYTANNWGFMSVEGCMSALWAQGWGMYNVQCTLYNWSNTGCPKKCPKAICSLNLFQRSDYTFSHVFRNENFEPVPSKHFKQTHSKY